MSKYILIILEKRNVQLCLCPILCLKLKYIDNHRLQSLQPVLVHNKVLRSFKISTGKYRGGGG